MEKRSKYVGEYRNNKRHGQGTYTYANGDEYVGEWKGGEMDGHGTYTWWNGEKYVGEFRNMLPHGLGTIILRDGDEWYDCEWEKGIEIRARRFVGGDAETTPPFVVY